MKTKILIVDDEPLNQTTLEAFLTGENYELHFADNGFDACAKAQIEQPDLVLLDVMMPEMDGFAVTRRIRADPIVGRIPIILVTALDDDRSRLEGLRAGADDFLTKPCRREELRARVRTVASLNRFRAIAEQRERFERLFELAPGGIVLTDEQGRVVAANAMAYNHRAQEPVHIPYGTSAKEPLMAGLQDALQGKPQVAREVRAGVGDSERVFHVRSAAVPEGSRRLVMFAFDDVTTEVRAREALRRMNSELEVQVRARTRQLEEANGLLLSYANFVSHDLRSPLTVMKGYLSMLREGAVPVNAEAAPLLDQAFGATLIMQELIQNILQLAQEEHDRPADGAKPAVDPTPVIKRQAMRMREIFPHSAARVDIDALPAVGVSAVMVERVFYNLLANAFKYSAARKEPCVQIGSKSDADGVVIFVRDNGVGFDTRDTDKLFHEFSRLETAHGTEGFGLGLSLVARLLKAHGGAIWAESAVGCGATFYVRFPRPNEVEPAEADLASLVGS